MAINFKNTHGDLMDSFFDPINGNFTQKNPLHGTKKDFQAPYSADSKRTSIPQIKNGITNVDDPVYTGFTFYIDTNTSPLFFTAKTSSGSGEYVIDKSDVMAETFNERIKYARTESSKYPNNDFWDSIGVGQNSTGKFNMDLPRLYYGAAEYLYMADSTSVLAKNNNILSSDVSKNTTTTSTPSANFDASIRKIKNKIEENNKKISDYEKTINEDYSDEKIKDAKSNNDNVNKEKQNLKNKLKETESEFNKSYKGFINFSLKDGVAKLSIDINKFKNITGVVVISNYIDYISAKRELDDFEKRNADSLKKYTNMVSSKEKMESDIRQLKEENEKLEKELANLVNQRDQMNTTTTNTGNQNATGVENSEALNNQTTSGQQTEPRGIPQSALNMVYFQNGFNEIITNHPYIFQTVEGLDAAYNKYFDVSKTPYMGSGEEKIKITCLESVDLKVSGLFNRYLNAAYDRQYRRERLPINMRRFNCSIIVHDIRNYMNLKTETGRLLYYIFMKRGSGMVDSFENEWSNLVERAIGHLSAVEFNFFDCEIVPEETGNIFTSVSNKEPGEVATTFSFKYGNCIVNYLTYSDLIGAVKDKISDDAIANESNQNIRTVVNGSGSGESSTEYMNITDGGNKYGDMNIKGNVFEEEAKTSETSDIGNVFEGEAKTNQMGMMGSAISSGIRAFTSAAQKWIYGNAGDDSSLGRLKTSIPFVQNGSAVSALTGYAGDLLKGVAGNWLNTLSAAEGKSTDKIMEESLRLANDTYGNNAFGQVESKEPTTSLGKNFENTNDSIFEQDLGKNFENTNESIFRQDLGDAYTPTNESIFRDDLGEAYTPENDSIFRGDLGEAYEPTNESIFRQDLGDAYTPTNESIFRDDLGEAYEPTNESIFRKDLGDAYTPTNESIFRQDLGDAYKPENDSIFRDDLGDAYAPENDSIFRQELGYAYKTPNKKSPTKDINPKPKLPKKNPKTKDLGKA